MNRRRLAWTIWGVSVGLVPIAVALDAIRTRVVVGEVGFVAVGVLLWATVGALITSKQMGNRVGLIFSGVALSAAVGLAGASYASLALERGMPLVAASSWVARLAFLGMLGPLAFLFLIFPTGDPPSRRWRWLLHVMLVAYAITALLFALTPGPMRSGFADLHRHVQNPLGLPTSWKAAIESLTTAAGFVVFGGALLSVVSLIQRYRRSSPAGRQQIRWLALLGAFTAALMVVMIALEGAGVTSETIDNLSFFLFASMLFLGVPITCGVAILKHGLWDLDVVVKKTVQYGALLVVAMALIGVLVILPGIFVFGIDRRVIPGIAIGVLVTLVLALLRVPARRFADRIVYGKRSTPYEVLSDFTERVGGTYSTEDVLPRMAQLLGEATGAKTARVWLRVEDVMREEASWPPDTPPAPTHSVAGHALPDLGEDEAFEVRHQGELLGALTVMIAADDPMNAIKAKLARDMASQAGLVLRNVRLIEDLRESRRRIVAAQDERAKKLERNIHDGAQQQLVALTVKLGLVGRLVERDSQAATMLAELKRDTNQALEDLRDLARGIYPPLLADKGLETALESQARKSSVPVAIESEGVGRYPAETEAAVYFSVLESIQNIAKYAEASRAIVRMAHANGTLTFEVADDGRGFDPDVAERGTGLQGIADRLAALGGELTIRSAPGEGTRVSGRLPVGAS